MYRSGDFVAAEGGLKKKHKKNLKPWNIWKRENTYLVFFSWTEFSFRVFCKGFSKITEIHVFEYAIPVFYISILAFPKTIKIKRVNSNLQLKNENARFMFSRECKIARFAFSITLFLFSIFSFWLFQKP